jgi:hypothetical protein
LAGKPDQLIWTAQDLKFGLNESDLALDLHDMFVEWNSGGVDSFSFFLSHAPGL